MNKKFIYVENWTKVDTFLLFPKHLWYLDYTPIEPIQLIQHYKCTKKAFKTAEETQTAGVERRAKWQVVSAVPY